MKFILFSSIILFSSCALTLISPGINSNYRIEDKSFMKMEDSAFYGSYFYRYFSYFVNEENYFDVINDPNNSIDVLQIQNFHINHTKNKILILYEFCFDKLKNIDWEEDLSSYTFTLNDQSNEYFLSYKYPYSYRKIGLKYKIELPYIINKKFPYHNQTERTGNDYILCMRNLLSFRKETQFDNSNLFKVTTPRGNTQHFEYISKSGKFQFYEKEQFEINGLFFPFR
jgi:hypothetical protein